MPRPEKVQAVEEIKERFSEASASFITEYRGLTVGQQQDLRNALRQAGASYKVMKMTLTRRALDELGNNDLDEYLTGPTAIAFASDDPVPVAKALKDFGSEHDALVVKAGWLNGDVLAPEMVAKLASIESRDVLLAKIAGAAKAPLTKLAGMLGSMQRDAASMFSQLLEKKEADAPAPADSVEAPTDEPADAAADEAADEATDEAAESSDAADDAGEATASTESDDAEVAVGDDGSDEEPTAADDDSEEATDDGNADADETEAAPEDETSEEE